VGYVELNLEYSHESFLFFFLFFMGAKVQINGEENNDNKNNKGNN